MKILKIVVDSAAIAAMRRYIVNRIGLKLEKDKEDELIKRVQEFLNRLNNMEDTDLWKYANEKEKRIAKKLASKYPDFLDHLTVDNVLRWLMYDVPIAYGIIVAHPNGIKWLEEVIDNIKQHLLEDVVTLEVVEEPSQSEEDIDLLGEA